MDKLNAMHIFLRVAETGSFTAAADQMDLARSVVTRQISALEKHLGTKLITRSTRSLTLTTAGSAYLEKCRIILNMVDAAESSLLEDKTELRGRIRLGLPVSFGLQRLMPALLEFAQAHSHIEMIMDYSDRRSKLIEEGIDLAIRITSRLEPGDIVRKLGEARLLTVASPQYLAEHSSPKHPSELSQHVCLVYSQDFQATTWGYRSNAADVNVTIRPRLVANSGDALLLAALQGLGITRTPDFIVQPYLDNGSVVAVLHEFEPKPLGIYAVLPSNRYVPHRVSVLIDFLAARLTGHVS